MGIAVVFPGQGSQAPGWGEPWRDEPAWAVVERAEAVLGEAEAPLLLDQTAALERTRDAQWRGPAGRRCRPLARPAQRADRGQHPVARGRAASRRQPGRGHPDRSG